MHIRAEALILSIRAHGEHGAVVRALTRAHGVQPGYVRGGRSRRVRPILQPANLVLGEWRARTEEQLSSLTVELIHSRAPLFAEPLPAALLDWATVLTTAALPEAQPFAMLHDALTGLFEAVEAAPAARGWASALVRYELLLLAELGFGLDLESCVVTGSADDLAFVSPRSGGAVSRAAAGDHAARLLPLPAFLRIGGPTDWPDILAGLAITGHFLERNVLVDRRREALTSRTRLIDRLKRAVA
ncbi:MAG: DNA repair protein RecO [Sphingomonas sp. 28-62-20]|uniref:DNA repair protein RecO n=1 Tax=Sphingomonas sp. 28-62-20 TaxID=1970433 RepID=UPI000BDD6F4A|nr:MAG: DNA repair protein RecO [Sphingomonas sp. 28-62-20]